MPAEIVPGEFCASWFGVYLVESFSRPGIVHTVTLSGGEGPILCDCEAFKYAPENNKTCRHTKLIYREACLWNCQWHEGNQPVRRKPNYIHYTALIPNSHCPNCSGPLAAVRIAV